MSTEWGFRRLGALIAWAGDWLGGLWESVWPFYFDPICQDQCQEQSLLGQNGQLGNLWIFLPPSKHPVGVPREGQLTGQESKNKASRSAFLVCRTASQLVDRRPGRREKVCFEYLGHGWPPSSPACCSSLWGRGCGFISYLQLIEWSPKYCWHLNLTFFYIPVFIYF